MWLTSGAEAFASAVYRIVVAHPYISLLALIAGLYVGRSANGRRSVAASAVLSLRIASRNSYRRSGDYLRITGRRWNEINLFTERDAPSRLIFGAIGAAMIVLSMRLSYSTLFPFVQAMNEILTPLGASPSLADQRDVAQLQTALMLIFEAIIGFICLEMFGVTDIMKFSVRFDRGANKAVRYVAAFGLLIFLGILGAYEGALSGVHDSLAYEGACVGMGTVIQDCKSLPGANLPSPSDSREEPPAPDAQKIIDAQRRIAALKTVQKFEHILAVAMPFVLMIVGLSFDFFEELYLPASSALAAVALWLFAVVVSALFGIAYLTNGVVTAATRVLILPAHVLVGAAHWASSMLKRWHK